MKDLDVRIQGTGKTRTMLKIHYQKFADKCLTFITFADFCSVILPSWLISRYHENVSLAQKIPENVNN